MSQTWQGETEVSAVARDKPTLYFTLHLNSLGSASATTATGELSLLMRLT